MCFATKSIQIGPTYISSMPPGLKLHEDFEFRIKNNPKPQKWAQNWVCFEIKQKIEHH